SAACRSNGQTMWRGSPHKRFGRIAPQFLQHCLGVARRTAINVFLMFHMASIACWCVPEASPLVSAYRSLIRPYFLWSGLFQAWDMFAPSPKATNSYIEAVVLYDGGDTRNWSFPRMEQLSLNERYCKERYRKFVENLEKDSDSPLWPDAARFIARLHGGPN